VPISAPIKDPVFWDRLAARELLIGQGDALDVELEYHQVYSDALGLWENDPQTFVITHVIAHVPRTSAQARLLD
jgi:hypothetical protein